MRINPISNQQTFKARIEKTSLVKDAINPSLVVQRPLEQSFELYRALEFINGTNPKRDVKFGPVLKTQYRVIEKKPITKHYNLPQDTRLPQPVAIIVDYAKQLGMSDDYSIKNPEVKELYNQSRFNQNTPAYVRDINIQLQNNMLDLVG